MCCEGRAANISAMPRHGNTQKTRAAPPGAWHPQGEKGTAVVLHLQHPALFTACSRRTREIPALPHRQLSRRSTHIQPPTTCPKGWVNTGALCPGLCRLHCHGPSLRRLHPALPDAAALRHAEFTPPRPKPLGPAKGHTRLGRDCGHPRGEEQVPPVLPGSVHVLMLLHALGIRR